MGKFDFIEAAASAYRFVWEQRRALAALALIPLLVKIGCYAAIALFGMDANPLRKGLMLLPAHLMEGFIVVLVIRMALFGEHFANLLETGAAARQDVSGAWSRNIMGGVVIYLLVKLVVSLFSGSLMIAQTIEKSPAMPEPNGAPFVTSIMIMIFAVWAFRFFWLYVPVAMGMTVRAFLELVKPFMSSVYMIGLWLLCSVPFNLVFVVTAKGLLTAFPGAAAAQPSAVYIIFIAVVQSVLELGIALTAAVAMGYAIRSMVSGAAKR